MGAELGEQAFDFAHAEIRFRVIERDRAVQAALRGLEPETRFLDVAEKMDGVPQEPGKGNDFARFIGREAVSRLAFRDPGPG